MTTMPPEIVFRDFAGSNKLTITQRFDGTSGVVLQIEPAYTNPHLSPDGILPVVQSVLLAPEQIRQLRKYLKVLNDN